MCSVDTVLGRHLSKVNRTCASSFCGTQQHIFATFWVIMIM